MNQKKESTKRIIKMEMLFLCLYAVIHFVLNFQTVVGTYVTTMLAFSYRYGFISRGFQGTVLLILDKLLPFHILSYEGAMVNSYLQIVFCDLMLLLFIYFVFKMSEWSLNHGILLCAFLFTTFAFPEYVAFQNFGRSDAWMVVILLIGAILLMKEKWEWLIIPICVVGVCIHQGFVLMFMAPLMVLLFVKTVNELDVPESGRLFLSKRGKKYFWIMGISIFASGALLLYFTFFSHTGSVGAYEDIYALAESMGYDGYEVKVHEQLIKNEILGQDPAGDEWNIHMYNFKEGFIYVLLTLPYLGIMFIFLKNCICKAAGIWQKLKYAAVAVGGAVILPDLIAKIDYGRWVFSLITYYFVTLMALLAMGDGLIVENFHEMAAKLKRHKIFVVFLLLYPLLMVPMGDTWISPISHTITDVLVELGW